MLAGGFFPSCSKIDQVLGISSLAPHVDGAIEGLGNIPSKTRESEKESIMMW
jgi:hypothetical protein